VNKYIVDTNVLLSHPEFLIDARDSYIIVPYGVIKELDKKKYEPGTLGLASRTVSRQLDDLRQKGDLTVGVETEAGSKILVVVGDDSLPADDMIIQMGLSFKSEGINCIILSNDINVRIKAAVNGLQTEADQNLNVKPEYASIRTMVVSDETINALFVEGSIPIQDGWQLSINEYFVIKVEGRSSSAVVQYDGEDLKLVKIPKSIFGITNKNVEQLCALHALMNENIPLVTMTGLAGSGKTLMAVAAALQATLEDGMYDKIVVIRPPVPVGRDVGFMPGSLREKMEVWAGSIIDNFSVLMKGNRKKNFEMLLDNGTIEILPPTFLRGRSMEKTFIILDEAQSLSRHEIKTIATRVGEGSKLVVTGDLEQIDNPRASIYDNGLAILKETFAGTEWAVCIDLQKSERSDFAAIAAQRL
jgi:PhoH-like ATPase